MKSTDTSIKTLSERGAPLATTPARIDLAMFEDAMANRFHPEKNPEGTFALNIAENAVSSQLIQEKLTKIMATQPLPRWTLKYTSSVGNLHVREVLATFLQTHFGSNALQPETLALSAGAGASLEVLAFVLTNPSNVVVIPAPAYPMYTNDLGTKGLIERYDLQPPSSASTLPTLDWVTVAHLEKAASGIAAQGKTIKMLLLTTPDNPTGAIYSGQQLREIAEWCMQHRVHLVVNEIYGQSLIANERNSTPPFQSFTKLMAQHQSEYLHWVYALSKDFCLSGLRVGMIHSHNSALMAAIGNLNLPHMVSNLTQWVIGELFKDANFIAEYIAENQRRITASYQLATSTLDAMHIPYVPAQGSLFIWADFSQFLSEDSAEGEEALWMALYQKTGILLTSGTGFGHQRYGLFRMVHTAVPTEQLKISMQRLAAFGSKKPT